MDWSQTRAAPAHEYRLRVGEFRVVYDVDHDTVLIVQILSEQDSLDDLGGSS